MQCVSDDIVDILGDSKVGVLGKDLFVAPPIPATPDYCVTVWDTGSFMMPDPNYLEYFYPTFQVRVRSEKERRKKAIEACHNIRKCLHYWQGVVADRRYLYILVATEIQYIGYDDLARVIYSMNYRAQCVPYRTAANYPKKGRVA